MDAGLYNKVPGQSRGTHGTLIHNWVEEQALHAQTGESRHGPLSSSTLTSNDSSALADCISPNANNTQLRTMTQHLPQGASTAHLMQSVTHHDYPHHANTSFPEKLFNQTGSHIDILKAQQRHDAALDASQRSEQKNRSQIVIGDADADTKTGSSSSSNNDSSHMQSTMRSAYQSPTGAQHKSVREQLQETLDATKRAAALPKRDTASFMPQGESIVAANSTAQAETLSAWRVMTSARCAAEKTDTLGVALCLYCICICALRQHRMVHRTNSIRTDNRHNSPHCLLLHCCLSRSHSRARNSHTTQLDKSFLCLIDRLSHLFCIAPSSRYCLRGCFGIELPVR